MIGDATNAGEPQAGGLLSGEASRNAAILRLKKQTSVGPNTGGTGLPKPERSLVQMPSAPGQSSTPGKKKVV